MSDYPMHEGGAALLDAMLYGNPPQGSGSGSEREQWSSKAPEDDHVRTVSGHPER
ncbi:MAG TPA: hypothetical protein VEI83_02580 [Acidimicrobiales bacterium]|nr:hypothetical protein [Acidimicrobiales bacterium]